MVIMKVVACVGILHCITLFCKTFLIFSASTYANEGGQNIYIFFFFCLKPFFHMALLNSKFYKCFNYCKFFCKDCIPMCIVSEICFSSVK